MMRRAGSDISTISDDHDISFINEVRRTLLYKHQLKQLEGHKRSFNDIKLSIKKYCRIYNYIKKNNMKLTTLLDNQKIASTLTRQISLEYNLLRDALPSFLCSSEIDTRDFKLPLNHREDVIALCDMVASLDKIVQNIIHKNDIQREQTIRMLEYELKNLQNEDLTGYVYLRNNLRHPVISLYLMYRSNGISDKQEDSESVIEHIIAYYRAEL